MKFMSRIIAVFALILCGSTSGRVAFAQNTSQQGQMPVWPQKQWNSAHNQWQRTPVDISTQTDTVSPDVRAKRHAYWTQPLQQWGLRIIDGIIPGQIVNVPEVGEIKGLESIWVVARFEGFHVFAIDPDCTSIYTEKNMRVIDVIKTPDDLPISSGSLLDVQIPGGIVKTAQGTVHALGVRPQPFAAQVGHTYLLHLLYDPHYGTMSTYQRWEIVSGTLLPDDRSESHRAQEGKSMLAGKSIDEAAKYILSVLKEQSEK